MTEPDWRSWADALAVEVETLLGVPSAEDRAAALQTLRDYDAACRRWQAAEEEQRAAAPSDSSPCPADTPEPHREHPRPSEP